MRRSKFWSPGWSLKMKRSKQLSTKPAKSMHERKKLNHRTSSTVAIWITFKRAASSINFGREKNHAKSPSIWLLGNTQQNQKPQFFSYLNNRLKGYSVRIGHLDFHPVGLSLDLEPSVIYQTAHPDPAVAVIPK